ncbi:MAG TPA: hypothetical protein DDZ80_05070 [Cyanobacteria bacterium UBA8803]|nr:hypothetical protein [Cyanobacteria bacterium UBA9273]HBL57918.1 hypothetical protein [Cyanobacteria bacterium UBA8803]
MANQQARILIHKIVSPDGKSIAEAQSIAIASGEQDSTIHQTVTVNISSNTHACSSSSSSSVSRAKSKNEG